MEEKNSYKKLEVELKRDSDEIFTPWQIQDFISKLVSNYYKLDLINAVSKKLNNGIQQENVFIIDESFNYNNHYSFLGESNKLNLDLEGDFKNFYHFGNPVSLLPNKDIYQINIKFKFFREINRYLGSKSIDKIDKSSLNTLILKEDKSGEKIYSIAISKLDGLEKEKRERCIKDLLEIKENYLENLREYSNDKPFIDYVKKKIYKNDIVKDDAFNNEIEEKYFKEFYRYFNRLERPIVGVYNPYNREIELLGVSFIYKKSRDERFLDIQEISHNSPPYCHIFVGLTFVVPTIVILKNILESNKKKISGISKVNNMERIEVLEQSNLTIGEDIIKLKELMDEEDLAANNDIKNKYANENLNDIHTQTVNKSVENIKECGFQNNNFKNNIINFEQHKK